jgi:3'(2'), 5'-bisphosphate nucleotidase
MATEDDRLAHDLAAEAGRRLIDLRARGGQPDDLRKAGDRLSHEFLAAELARLRPGDWVLSEEAADNPARLAADRVWIVDPLDGTREFGDADRTDWAVHVALWERSGPGQGRLTVGAVALPAAGEVLSTVAPPAAPPGPPPGRPRIVVSRSRPAAFLPAMAELLGADLDPLGSAGARRRPVRMGFGGPGRGDPGGRVPRFPDRRPRTHLQSGRSADAGYSGVYTCASRRPAGRDQLRPGQRS